MTSNRNRRRALGVIIAGAGLLFICVATLTPGTPLSPDELAAVCRRWCDDSIVADFVRNIALFAPLAFGLRLAGVRWVYVLVFGSCLSAAVELLQLRVIVGRDASMLDWLSNTTGTATGILLADWLSTVVRPSPRLASRFLISTIVAWTGILLLGAWGIQPAPGDFPYFGERAPRLASYEPFLGEIISARVDGLELPPSLIKNDDSLRAGLRARQTRVEATVRAGPWPASSNIAPIVRVADGAEREILMLGRGGHELVFRYRLRATTLRLETPAFALAQAFQLGNAGDPESPDTLETLSATLSGGRVQLLALSAGMSKARAFELSPAAAWSFFLPWDYWYGPNSVWISYLWLSGLLLPAGYWAAFVRRERRGLWLLFAAIGVVAIDLALIPYFFGMRPASVWSYLAAYAGLALGWSLSVLAQRSRASRVA